MQYKVKSTLCKVCRAVLRKNTIPFTSDCAPTHLLNFLCSLIWVHQISTNRILPGSLAQNSVWAGGDNDISIRHFTACKRWDKHPFLKNGIAHPPEPREVMKSKLLSCLVSVMYSHTVIAKFRDSRRKSTSTVARLSSLTNHQWLMFGGDSAATGQQMSVCGRERYPRCASTPNAGFTPDKPDTLHFIS